MRVDHTQIGTLGGAPEDLPRIHLTRQRAIALSLFVASAIGFLYFVLPKLTGLGQTWDRIGRGTPGWLVLAVGFEALSFAGYVALFRTVFVRDGRSRINLRTSYEITMAGLAATRLFASAGAGGVALTAWALRRSGMPRRLVAARMVAFMTLLYAVYMLALVLFGIGLRTRLLPGGGSFAVTIVPAIFGGVVILLALLLTRLPGQFERQIEAVSRRTTRGGKLIARLLSLPALIGDGVRGAIGIVARRDPLALGAIAWWGFDIATLWASFHAFGSPPPFAVIVMAYFLGMFGNLLPLPGGIGGVDGGMIGALIAFGVNDPLAVVAVLVYRGFAFWLPTIPGAVAYFQLRRRVHGWTVADGGAAAGATRRSQRQPAGPLAIGLDGGGELSD
ncbi:MAG: lysylphosphatidylglycerol synthase transmembrane domain-containing protein [Solirubrobacteraceae bacterium]